MRRTNATRKVICAVVCIAFVMILIGQLSVVGEQENQKRSMLLPNITSTASSNLSGNATSGSMITTGSRAEGVNGAVHELREDDQQHWQQPRFGIHTVEFEFEQQAVISNGMVFYRNQTGVLLSVPSRSPSLFFDGLLRVSGATIQTRPFEKIGLHGERDGFYHHRHWYYAAYDVCSPGIYFASINVIFLQNEPWVPSSCQVNDSKISNANGVSFRWVEPETRHCSPNLFWRVKPIHAREVFPSLEEPIPAEGAETTSHLASNSAKFERLPTLGLFQWRNRDDGSTADRGKESRRNLQMIRIMDPRAQHSDRLFGSQRSKSARRASGTATTICFVGDSHTRHLHRSVLDTLVLESESKDFPVQNENLRATRRVELLKQRYLYFPLLKPQLHRVYELRGMFETLDLACSVVLLNFGQWDAGWPYGDFRTVEEFSADAEQFFAVLKRVRGGETTADTTQGDDFAYSDREEEHHHHSGKQPLPLLKRVFWMPVPPFPIPYWHQRSACPARHWRFPHVLRAYDKVSQTIARKFGVAVVGDHELLADIRDFTEDGSHVSSRYLRLLMPALIEPAIASAFPNGLPSLPLQSSSSSNSGGLESDLDLLVSQLRSDQELLVRSAIADLHELVDVKNFIEHQHGSNTSSTDSDSGDGVGVGRSSGTGGTKQSLLVRRVENTFQITVPQQFPQMEGDNDEERHFVLVVTGVTMQVCPFVAQGRTETTHHLSETTSRSSSKPFMLVATFHACAVGAYHAWIEERVFSNKYASSSPETDDGRHGGGFVVASTFGATTWRERFVRHCTPRNRFYWSKAVTVDGNYATSPGLGQLHPTAPILPHEHSIPIPHPTGLFLVRNSPAMERFANASEGRMYLTPVPDDSDFARHFIVDDNVGDDRKADRAVSTGAVCVCTTGKLLRNLLPARNTHSICRHRPSDDGDRNQQQQFYDDRDRGGLLSDDEQLWKKCERVVLGGMPYNYYPHKGGDGGRGGHYGDDAEDEELKSFTASLQTVVNQLQLHQLLNATIWFPLHDDSVFFQTPEQQRRKNHHNYYRGTTRRNDIARQLFSSSGARVASEWTQLLYDVTPLFFGRRESSTMAGGYDIDSLLLRNVTIGDDALRAEPLEDLKGYVHHRLVGDGDTTIFRAAGRQFSLGDGFRGMTLPTSRKGRKGREMSTGRVADDGSTTTTSKRNGDLLGLERTGMFQIPGLRKHRRRN